MFFLKSEKNIKYVFSNTDDNDNAGRHSTTTRATIRQLVDLAED